MGSGCFSQKISCLHICAVDAFVHVFRVFMNCSYHNHRIISQKRDSRVNFIILRAASATFESAFLLNVTVSVVWLSRNFLGKRRLRIGNLTLI